MADSHTVIAAIERELAVARATITRLNRPVPGRQLQEHATMSNARNRDLQLKRQSLRTPRVTNRVVAPPPEARFLPTAIDTSCRACGHILCSCTRVDPAVMLAKRGGPAPVLPARDLPPGWVERYAPTPMFPGGTYLHEGGASISSFQDGRFSVCAPIGRVIWKSAASRDEAMALALGWFREGPSSWFFKKLDGTGRMQVEPAKGLFIGYRGAPSWEEKHGLPSLPHAIAWCRGEG